MYYFLYGENHLSSYGPHYRLASYVEFWSETWSSGWRSFHEKVEARPSGSWKERDHLWDRRHQSLHLESWCCLAHRYSWTAAKQVKYLKKRRVLLLRFAGMFLSLRPEAFRSKADVESLRWYVRLSSGLFSCCQTFAKSSSIVLQYCFVHFDQWASWPGCLLYLSRFCFSELWHLWDWAQELDSETQELQ